MELTTLVYYRHTNFAPEYDYSAATEPLAYEPPARPISYEPPINLAVEPAQNSNFKVKYWTLVFVVCALPLLNSTIVNAYSLSKNIFKNVSLSKQRNKLLKEKAVFKEKLNELSTDAGLNRAIKQEMNLLHRNEILIKLSTVH